MTKRVMKLVNEYTGKMQCKVCGSEHYASVKPRSNGRYYRGSWQCVYGCKLPTSVEPQAYDGWNKAWIDVDQMYSA